MNPVEIENAARAYGSAMATAMDALAKACAHGGRGMNQSGENEQFEHALERHMDELVGRTFHEAVADLFLSSARLAFYGETGASAVEIKRWKTVSQGAFAELSRDAA